MAARLSASARSPVCSVNYFISRKCNYSCKFCFHTQKNTNRLTLDVARLGLKRLAEAGTEKINFAGGEPFMHPFLLGELCRTSKELGMAVSIISNGSLITSRWMSEYGSRFVDILGLSVDSFHSDTNAKIGRGGKSGNKHIERMLRVRDLCTTHDIKFKMNTVVCSVNWQEDMSENLQRLDPARWKVFQVLILKDENSGGHGELRDARPLVVSREQFDSFVQRHERFNPIAEPNDVMQNSYLLLDEEMRFLNCSGGGKTPSESIVKVGVLRALQQAGFDFETFCQRGGIYDWNRAQPSSNLDIRAPPDSGVAEDWHAGFAGVR